jgi:hypothetical protein
MIEPPSCSWCDWPILSVAARARPQGFCRPPRKTGLLYSRAGWDLDLIAEGTLTVREISERRYATRALAPAVGFLAITRRPGES